jgi:hypothetical protein
LKTLQSSENAEDAAGDVPSSLDMDYFVTEASAMADAITISLEKMGGFQEEFKALEVPESASALHEEILAFYANGITTLEGAASFMRDEATVMQPLASALKAIDSLTVTSNTTAQEAQAVVDQLQGSLAQLNGFESSSGSEDMARLQEALAAYLESEAAFFSTLQQIISSWSQSLENQYNALIEDTQQKLESAFYVEMEIVQKVEDGLSKMDEDLNELMKKVSALE